MLLEKEEYLYSVIYNFINVSIDREMDGLLRCKRDKYCLIFFENFSSIIHLINAI